MSKPSKTSALILRFEKLDRAVDVQLRQTVGQDIGLNELSDFVAEAIRPVVLEAVSSYYQKQQKETQHVTH